MAQTHTSITFYTEQDEEITVRGKVYFGRTPSNGDDPSDAEILGFERKSGEEIAYSVGLELYQAAEDCKTLDDAEQRIIDRLFDAGESDLQDAYEAAMEARAERLAERD